MSFPPADPAAHVPAPAAWWPAPIHRSVSLARRLAAAADAVYAPNAAHYPPYDGAACQLALAQPWLPDAVARGPVEQSFYGGGYGQHQVKAEVQSPQHLHHPAFGGGEPSPHPEAHVYLANEHVQWIYQNPYPADIKPTLQLQPVKLEQQAFPAMHHQRAHSVPYSHPHQWRDAPAVAPDHSAVPPPTYRYDEHGQIVLATSPITTQPSYITHEHHERADELVTPPFQVQSQGSLPAPPGPWEDAPAAYLPAFSEPYPQPDAYTSTSTYTPSSSSTLAGALTELPKKDSAPGPGTPAEESPPAKRHKAAEGEPGTKPTRGRPPRKRDTPEGRFRPYPGSSAAEGNPASPASPVRLRALAPLGASPARPLTPSLSSPTTTTGTSVATAAATAADKADPARRQPLACLYCRRRKIACGAPAPGAADRTCVQCARRELPCEYPTENRRGKHKRRRRVVEGEVGEEPVLGLSAPPAVGGGGGEDTGGRGEGEEFDVFVFCTGREPR